MQPNQVTKCYELDHYETELLALKPEDNLWPFSSTGDLLAKIDQARTRLLDQPEILLALPGTQRYIAVSEHTHRLTVLRAMERIIETGRQTPFTEIENFLQENS